MSIGFRKSLLGFNTDDVINYVKKLHSAFAEKEAKLEGQISELENKINALTLDREALEKDKSELQLQINEYDSKKAEIERLGENIGKLYLVSQANAQTVMSNAEADAKAAYTEAQRNVSAIEETHMALDDLRKNIRETTENFNNSLTLLMSSLEATKEKLNTDKQANEAAQKEFAALLEAVAK